MYEKGCRPFVAIPTTEKGGSKTVDLSNSIITFGRAPHIPQSNWTLYRLDVGRDLIKPKLTGPDISFNGVVAIADNKVGSNLLEAIEYKTGPTEVVEETREKLAA
jgi:hypothetical protein